MSGPGFKIVEIYNNKTNNDTNATQTIHWNRTIETVQLNENNSMKAIHLTKFGMPKHLKIVRVLKPEPSKDQVLVRVKAASINPEDVYLRLGNITHRPDLPIIIGKEAAGIIVKINTTSKSDFKIGDKVICCFPTYGAYAQYIVCNMSYTVRFPDNLTYYEAATIYMSYFSAYRALIQKAKLRRKETVYIHGGTGGFGIAALQLAKHLNCSVTTTFGNTHAGQKLLELGADFIQNHRKAGHSPIFLEKHKFYGYDVILETQADTNLGHSVFCLNKKGRIVLVNALGHGHLNPYTFIIEEAIMIGLNISSATTTEFQEMSGYIMQGVRDGWVKPLIHRIYPMDNITQAHTDFQFKKRTLGKYVLEF